MVHSADANQWLKKLFMCQYAEILMLLLCIHIIHVIHVSIYYAELLIL